MSELDILPSEIHGAILAHDRHDGTASYKAIRAYLLRVTAERDALAKRIEVAPRARVIEDEQGYLVVEGYELFTEKDRGKRVALVVLED